MMRNLVNVAAGLIFGVGLLISGMANPAKVQNFLDLAGSFDPSLIFVMGGALVVTFAGYRLVLRRQRPLLTDGFLLPTLKDVDQKRPDLCETCRALFLENADEIGDSHEQEEHADPADR